jgi:hypothetical protein
VRRTGIDYPESIDFITRGDGVVRLVLVEPRQLSEDDAPALQEKLNNYLGYVINGMLQTQHPESIDDAVRIRVELATEQISFIHEFLLLYASTVAEYDVAFEVVLDGEVII